MSAHRPRVFSATVLPPAFGPVMASPRCPGRSSRSMGTTARPLRRRSGWRAASSRTSSPPRAGRVQSCRRANAAAAPSASASRQRDLERLQCRRRVTNPRGQLGAYAAFLGLLGLGGEEQAVVELDGEQRFDEDRLVGLGAVLHHALEGPRGGGADGHDVASVPHRDVLVADDAGLRGIAHHGQELRLEPRPQVARGASRRRERRARVLADLAALVEHRGERGFDVGRLGQAVGHRGETREAVGIASQMVAHLPRHQQEVPHLDQPARLQRGARRRRLLRGPDRDAGRRRWAAGRPRYRARPTRPGCRGGRSASVRSVAGRNARTASRPASERARAAMASRARGSSRVSRSRGRTEAILSARISQGNAARMLAS